MTDRVQLIVLRTLATAVRGVTADGSACTYRHRSGGSFVPGQCLTVAVTKTWPWRRSMMMSGDLVSRSFSLRALHAHGFALPKLGPTGIESPGLRDDRMGSASAELGSGAWIVARTLLLDLLETHPGCLVAHSLAGCIAAQLEHDEDALAHLTAAVRLAMGALASGNLGARLDARRDADRAALVALRTRAEVLARRGELEAATADLRRALTWDPSDAIGAQATLDALTPSTVTR